MKIYSAGKSYIDKVNRADRADCMAFAASAALVVIDFCAEILNGNCFIRAGLDALHAADTAGGAFLPGDAALVVVFALDGGLDLFEGHHFDKTLRAGFKAHLARLAHSGVNVSNTVNYADCVILAGIHTVAEAEAAVDAFLVTAVNL